MSVVLDLLLAAVVMGVAVWTIAAREAFAAVIGFVAYGLLLSIVWVRLATVDVALTEAAIGSGVTGVLLIGAAGRLRASEALSATERPGRVTQWMAVVLSAVVAVALGAVVLMLPPTPASLAPAALADMAPLGMGNPITAVLIAYRAIDTLQEKVVLVLAVVAVWSLAPDRVWGGRPGRRHTRDRDGVLTFPAQLLPPIGIVVGIYTLWAGADEPGGAFQGGAILAAMWILSMLAGLTDAPAISRPWVRLAVVVGPAAFAVVGLSGWVVATHFLAYPAGFAKPLILAVEAVLTLSIAVMLGLLVAGPPEREPGS